jgi:hypothetical protein
MTTELNSAFPQTPLIQLRLIQLNRFVTIRSHSLISDSVHIILPVLIATHIRGIVDMPKMRKQAHPQTGNKMIECLFCRTPTRTDNNTSALLCGRCVIRLSDPVSRPSVAPEVVAARKQARAERKAERKATVPSGRGRGWHLKRLFIWEGQAYSFGKPISAQAAAQLANS